MIFAIWVISKLLIVSHLWPDVNNNRIVSFNVSFFNDKFRAGYQLLVLSRSNTSFGFQMVWYLGCGGFSLKIPFIYIHMTGLEPSVQLSIFITIADNAERAVFKALYPKLYLILI